MPYTDFHYVPTGTGVISGKEVLEQTEDAINDLGQQTAAGVDQAIETANNAMNTANTANTNAQNAVNTANTANTTATSAQNTANAAQTTASNALTAAQNAQNDVNALGNRVTTAENNIVQNTSDISGLTTRMGTAEGNITTLQNDVVTAQGTATSAQNTATLARGQAYVVRYANVAVSDNSTVPYTDLNNTDNIKANDLLLDTNGKIYQITSVDSANETVSVTTPLTQLAVDNGVMHLSGNETVAGIKNFIDETYIKSLISTNAVASPSASGSSILPMINKLTYTSADSPITARYNFCITAAGEKSFYPHENNQYSLGLSSRRHKDFYTYLINGLNPGSLSLPDLNNGIDISGYLTTGTSSNSYTALADGYISILTTSSSNSAIYWNDANNVIGGNAYAAVDIGGSDRITNILIPANKGITYTIVFESVNTIVSAKFFPCLGNV